MRYALGLEYNGCAFCGFQSQPSGCGVQDAIEAALSSIAGHRVAVVAAGRTDAGVHATSQIVHFDTDAQRPATAWVRGVNASLLDDAAVLWTVPAQNDFHARYSATARHYVYLLHARAERLGLLVGRVGWYHRPLDVDAMQSAAALLLGEHDFSSFRAAECQARSPVKTLARASVAASGPLIRLDFSADGFLHHMIRNIVGALVHVGAGKAPSSYLRELLDARDRTLAPPTFMGEGLYFVGADYDARFELPATRRDIALPIS
ncbi:MAG TPA: tRNA pseudouridine(38-40) synthase TruA [Casimicrobiaceae bacterium]|nr:tRNA pseudouridine(38-40) synthase TruA [Casimicrobiaceae bacterium]